MQPTQVCLVLACRNIAGLKTAYCCVLTGIESAWHLERVQVLNSSTGELVTFKCRAWLDATSEDGLIEREFYPMTECTYKLELQASLFYCSVRYIRMW